MENNKEKDKTLVVANDVHKSFKAYCDSKRLKINKTCEEIIKQYLATESKLKE